METRGQSEDALTPVLAKVATPSAATDARAKTFDCWNQIGVAGDGSCAELAQVVHCRNCPVYSAAGTILLDRDLPPDYRKDWTQHFAREKDHAKPGKSSMVLFRIGAEWLALPTQVFQEVTECRTIHSLPHRRHSVVLGLINVRGELLICVSLARLLGIENGNAPSPPPKPHHRLVVAEWQGNVLAFPVDEIHGIHRHHPEDVKPAPAGTDGAKPSFATGLISWSGGMAGCLDANLVFSTLNRNLS